jgi:hypothetical protein
MAPEGVDEAMHGVIDFGGRRRLLFSCGFDSPSGTFSRLIGTEGEIRLTNPFHPGADDTIEVHSGGDVRTEDPGAREPSFTPAVRHIGAVVRGEEAPRHLAVTDVPRTALAMQMCREFAATHSS